MLHSMETGEVKKALLERKGIGPKVADCICLYGLHRMDSFPMDTHMRQVVALYYPEGFPFLALRGMCGADAAISLLLSSKEAGGNGSDSKAIIEGRVVEGL